MSISIRQRVVAACLAGCLAPAPAAAQAQEISAFMQSLAGEASGDGAVASFYRDTGYEAIWTDPEEDDRARLSALIVAVEASATHALPRGRFTEQDIRQRLTAVRTEANRARTEAELSRLFLDYAHAVQSGILDPDRTGAGIKRTAPRRDGAELLSRLVEEAPGKVMRSLPPATPEYANLVRARMDLARTVAAGGWGGEVPAGRLELGDSGPGVVALRNRLIAMGFLDRTASDTFDSDTFDEELDATIRRFQEEHGLLVDGIVGGNTLEELNASAEERLGQVVVAMERERWLNLDRGARHVWVNLADFSARLIDDGKVTFETRAVTGAASSDRQSPEFSDQMDHMVINPTWHVPRSIAVNEYMPDFKRNPYAHRQLTIYYQGQPVSRERINWPVVTAGNWPFELKQPPSNSNALGLVKFMFPNRWNIYLHDTPAKDLFGRTSRAFSHGCIRLQEPFEFAYTLLERQTDDPVGFFQSRLDTGRETRVNLETPVPVHLVYRTAFTTPTGELRFRPDIYGRDATVRAALEAAGVEIGGLPS